MDIYATRHRLLCLELAGQWIIDPVQPRGSTAGGAVEGEEVVEGEHDFVLTYFTTFLPPTQSPAKENAR
ncbi:MAG: hypothetical protein PVF74_10510 [Anaerolineales bacterium]